MHWICISAKVCTRELQKSHQTTYTDADTILSGPLIPKLQSLTLFFLDILFSVDYELLSALAWRHEHGIGLESLVVQECCMHRDEVKIKFEEQVKDVTWED